MKKQVLFTILSMLLCASAFAQSTNGMLKGDVNGDGKVDVADINAVISIMKKGEAGYFYLGTMRPTAWGYQTLPGVVSTYTSIGEAHGTTVSVAAGETLYMLCPTGWMDGKEVEIEDGNGNTFNFLEDFDATTISGYVIYKTQVWNDDANITLKTPTTDYYVGWTNGTKSEFAAKSDSEIINGATGYSSVSTPTYTRAYGSNNIFYLLYQTSKTPQSIVFISNNTRMTQDIVNDNTCPHTDVVINGVTYKEFGIRLTTGYDPNDSIELNF